MNDNRSAIPIVPIAQPRSALAQVEVPVRDVAQWRDVARRTSR